MGQLSDGSDGSWVTWVMGQLSDGSVGSWVIKCDPLTALPNVTARCIIVLYDGVSAARDARDHELLQ